MSNELLRTTQEWIDYGVAEVNQHSGIPVYDPDKFNENEKMWLASDIELESAPLNRLTYYQSCLSFFNSQSTFWKSVANFLDNHYRNATEKYVVDLVKSGGKITFAQTESKAVYANLRTARTIAEDKHERWKADAESAEGMRDITSRAVTIMEIERRQTAR